VLGLLVVVGAISRSSLGSGGTSATAESDEIASPSVVEGALQPDGAKLVAVARTKPSGDGFAVVQGTGRTAGAEDAPLLTYTVEVEPKLKPYAATLKDVSDAALLDGARGWTSQGERRVKRIDDASAANIRVVLATPATVDKYCAQVGAMTNGTFSCWDGSRAMINLDRWNESADDFKSLARYRTYVVNHEVGHGLGQTHRYCSAAGQLAPVMMQQTKGTAGCRANGWPYP
jgi:hypothetical protein